MLICRLLLPSRERWVMAPKPPASRSGLFLLNVKERRHNPRTERVSSAFAYGLVIIKCVEGAIEGGNVWPGARVSAPAALAFAVVGSCAG